MKQGIVIVFLCSVGVLGLTGALTQQQIDHGPITPKLTMVATVDGKAFYVDSTTPRDRATAKTYCASLGMRLAEITSASQFLALDQAVINEWQSGSDAWIGGIETKTILRYAWENSKVGLDPSYIPYSRWLDEDSNYFLYFLKRVNGSTLRNLQSHNICESTLCETLPNVNQN